MTLFDPSIAPQTYAAIRFGMGFPLREAPADADAILQRLAGPDHVIAAHPMLSFQAAVDLTNGIRQARKSKMMDPKAALSEARDAQNRAMFRALRDEFIRAVETDDPFRERLMAFWANHFTTRAKGFFLRTGHAGFAAEALRPHLAGRFPDMLRAVVKHPFMLHYLDQRSSVGPNSDFGQAKGRGLNENYARELIELHTLGASADYTQADVRQLAELLTGLTAGLREGFQFRPDWAEPGAEEILGTRYGGGAPDLADIDAALEDLALHPATAGHLARKLAAHFVADAPGAGLVTHMASAYLAARGDLMALYAAMLEHPDAWRGFGAKAKTPLEMMLTACRAYGLRGADFAALGDGHLRKMIARPLMLIGQRYAEPPGPDGWPDRVSDWITPHGLAGRLNWIMGLTRTVKHIRPDPRRFVTEALGDAASPGLRFAATAAETREEGVMLILASAEFNRR